ncbi:hypothetical protein ABZS86_09680 [Streptomyces sp. NPDC005355]|uniref:hypothetical protein n=1 Tax=Streptomyces sp. NPDC005355 TaxID=3157038 RepID=UPI0033B463D4
MAALTPPSGASWAARPISGPARPECSTPSTPGSRPRSTTCRRRRPRPADTAGHAAQKAVRPVQEPVEQQARKITEPVGDLARHTAGDRLPVRLPDVGLGEAGGAGHDGFAPSHGLTEAPTVPAGLPTVPADLPTVPAQLPTVPADLPTVPAGLPTVPAQLPTVPAGLPTVPVGLPTAPGALPAV